MFSKFISLGVGKSNSIQFEKISKIPIILDAHKPETKLYGLILKDGLELYGEEAQGIIVAFSNTIADLQPIEKQCDEPCVIRELLVINWLGFEKPGHQFYAVQNKYGCEGIIYTSNITTVIKENSSWN